MMLLPSALHPSSAPNNPADRRDSAIGAAGKTTITSAMEELAAGLEPDCGFAAPTQGS